MESTEIDEHDEPVERPPTSIAPPNVAAHFRPANGSMAHSMIQMIEFQTGVTLKTLQTDLPEALDLLSRIHATMDVPTFLQYVQENMESYCAQPSLATVNLFMLERLVSIGLLTADNCADMRNTLNRSVGPMPLARTLTDDGTDPTAPVDPEALDPDDPDALESEDFFEYPALRLTDTSAEPNEPTDEDIRDVLDHEPILDILALEAESEFMAMVLDRMNLHLRHPVTVQEMEILEPLMESAYESGDKIGHTAKLLLTFLKRRRRNSQPTAHGTQDALVTL